jgi:hypothetical protein
VQAWNWIVDLCAEPFGDLHEARHPVLTAQRRSLYSNLADSNPASRIPTLLIQTRQLVFQPC